MAKKRKERGENKSIFISAENKPVYDNIEREAEEKRIGVGALICEKLKGSDDE